MLSLTAFKIILVFWAFGMGMLPSTRKVMGYRISIVAQGVALLLMGLAYTASSILSSWPFLSIAAATDTVTDAVLAGAVPVLMWIGGKIAFAICNIWFGKPEVEADLGDNVWMKRLQKIALSRSAGGLQQ